MIARALLGLLLALAATSALGQWREHLGIATQLLFEATAARPGHHWMRWDWLSSYTDEGDNVVYYMHHNHVGRGPAFGQVIEINKLRPEGNIWGQEIDLGVTGGRQPGVWRIGQGVVVLSRDGGEAWISHGFRLMPFDGGSGPHRARTDYGLSIEMPCVEACVSIPGDQAIRLSPDPAVGELKFDITTGYLGFWRRDGLCIWCVNQTHGDVRTMWRP